LKSIGGIRAALRSGHGFTGDRESLEAELQRAREASSETNLNTVAEVIAEYRGRIRLCREPDLAVAVQEGTDLAARLKQEAQGR
jgi:hypothetical protein